MMRSTTDDRFSSRADRLAGCGASLLLLLLTGACGGPAVEELALDASRVTGYVSTRELTDLHPRADGTLLAAGAGGLLRFDSDGALVATVTRVDGLPGNNVQELLVTETGETWVATTAGVARDRGLGWETFTVSEGLNDDRTLAIEQDRNGVIHVGTERGIAVFDGERFHPLNDTHEFGRRPTHDIHRAADGTLWFAKQNALTHQLGPGSWQVFQRDPLQPGPRARLISNDVVRVAGLATGTVLVGTRSAGIGSFDGASWAQTVFAEHLGAASGLLDNRIAALTVDRDGRTWVGYGRSRSDIGGLGVSVLQDGGWTHLTVADGLPANEVHAIRQARDGGLWFATSRGAARWDGSSFRRFEATGTLASNHVRAIVTLGDGAVGIVTASGLEIVRSGEAESVRLPNGAQPTCVTGSLETLVVGTESGLWTRSAGVWSVDPQFEGRNIRSAATGTDGNLWVALSDGLHGGGHGRWVRPPALNDANEFHFPRIEPAADGAIWISGVGATRDLLKLDADEPRPLRGLARLQRPDLARATVAPDGRDWVVTEDGLFDLLGRETLDPPASLELNPRVARWDRSGRVWVGTASQGLWMHDGVWRRVLLHGHRFPLEITDLRLEGDDALWVGTASEGALRIDLRGVPGSHEMSQATADADGAGS